MLHGIPYHRILRFYSLFPFNPEKYEDMDELAKDMKQRNISPYIYIQKSLKHLVHEDYNNAYRTLEFAGRLGESYYKAGTIDFENYSNTIVLLQYLELHLSDEFNQCCRGVKAVKAKRYRDG